MTIATTIAGQVKIDVELVNGHVHVHGRAEVATSENETCCLSHQSAHCRLVVLLGFYCVCLLCVNRGHDDDLYDLFGDYWTRHFRLYFLAF